MSKEKKQIRSWCYSSIKKFWLSYQWKPAWDCMLLFITHFTCCTHDIVCLVGHHLTCDCVTPKNCFSSSWIPNSRIQMLEMASLLSLVMVDLPPQKKGILMAVWAVSFTAPPTYCLFQPSNLPLMTLFHTLLSSCWLFQYQIACAGGFPIGMVYCSYYSFSKCTEVKLSCVCLPDLANSHVPASKLCHGQASHMTGQYSDSSFSLFITLTFSLSVFSLTQEH